MCTALLASLRATHVESRMQTSTVVRDGKRITRKTTTTRDAQGNVSTTTEEHEEDAGAAGSQGGFLGFDGGGFGGGEGVPSETYTAWRALACVPLVPLPLAPCSRGATAASDVLGQRTWQEAVVRGACR